MTGLSNYSAFNLLNWLSGQIAVPALPAVFMSLFTAVGTDAGTGFTEVGGGVNYARVQVAGAVAATASFTAATPNITMTTNPGWVTPGMSVYDLTNGFLIGTVLTYIGTALVLTANALHASSGSTDSLSFSAFGNAAGTGPASISNQAAVSYLAATGAGFGTIIAWGLHDAVSAGNLLVWDYLGNFQWLPATVSAASPGVLTTKAHGYSNGDSFVFSVEYGGTAPSFSAGNYNGLQTVAGVTTDTLNVTGVNTSATGDGSIRKVSSQSIPAGVTASFAVGQLNALAA